ncbi:MAG: hypothetical protein E6Z82_09995 [Neisseria sp.]|nr:hypothetical protein [Stenotrophomonas sp. Sm10]MDU5727918.1 hypothetical protein [Neisseria sp.]
MESLTEKGMKKRTPKETVKLLHKQRAWCLFIVSIRLFSAHYLDMFV